MGRKRKGRDSEPELQGNLASLYIGGTDTILSSLGWLFRIMCAHKDIQEKVYQELMEVVGKDGRARYDERDKIPYTSAVLMEAQRYASIIPFSGNRMHVSKLLFYIFALHIDLDSGSDSVAKMGSKNL
ncbi:hypothetical protein AVEN_223966-1 [Araneus ventricosus]|uniref:Uncharacterized protein n=1 Tax=Araneus ventricosus TaxID=182803 RepID=A0A4Y2W7L2_ARAVE|nr:hypothetical protein AVEN_104185-1 [Araneus ventricosus]GBO33150.1 hypothetical protein AVEN_223966-1 [Araneus ventricosus]